MTAESATIQSVTGPSVGVALIAKNEQENLPRLLASIEGAFDQVVLVDTGSTDDTLEVFEAWAVGEQLRNERFRFDTAHFEWCEDFSKPRQLADDMLTTDWKVWADCDDTIEGAQQLRDLAARAPDELGAFLANYRYAHDPHGNVICQLRRERLVRAGVGSWQGRVHEAQALAHGAVTEIPDHLIRWVHHKQPGDTVPDRNLQILLEWVEDEPESPRVLGYLGTEYLARLDWDQSIAYFRRYLALKTGWDEERAQIHRKLAVALMHKDEHEEAIRVAFEAMRLLPNWPDSYLTLAEAHYRLREVDKAASWADEVLRRGVPQSLLIINPLDYTVQPKVVLAGAKAATGDIPGALKLAEEVFAIVPGHPLLVEPYKKWWRQRKTGDTAEHFVSAAQTLIAHDEQLKALQVLEAVPHFAYDDIAVVQLRSQLRERLYPLFDPTGYAEHYETGGSKPEDFVKDEDVMPLGAALPRCRFLLDGLRDQLGIADA